MTRLVMNTKLNDNDLAVDDFLFRDPVRHRSNDRSLEVPDCCLELMFLQVNMSPVAFLDANVSWIVRGHVSFSNR